jgi:hypothetical protein
MGDGGQLGVVRVVQMIGVGRGKQDTLDPTPPKQPVEERVPPGPKRRQDIGKGLPHILDRPWASINRPQHIDQDNLPVDPCEMVGKERPDHIALVALIAALKLLSQRLRSCHSRLWQGREG